MNSKNLMPIHSWLRQIHVAYEVSHEDDFLDRVASQLLDTFQQNGHQVQVLPDEFTDLILTTAPFGKPVNWREALLFTGRMRFGLDHNPMVVTLMHATPSQFQETLAHLERILEKEPPDPADYDFPGMADKAYQVLFEQGRRGGAIMALERLLQGQSKTVRILLFIGEDQPEKAYTFDLVGAHPISEARDPEAFYQDLMLRLVTAVSTYEITEHQAADELIPRSVWDRLSTPEAMRTAAQKLGRRNFFTEMVRIADLVNVPMVAETISSQYSEGCFATWDPVLEGLVTTVTGSARPVDKDDITEKDLAVIVGVREDRQGAVVRHVEGKQNDPPSSEAVELMDMDSLLPMIELDLPTGTHAVPVVRSKLHGHRGVAAFDPRWVEHVPLDEPYYHFPVSCSTEAQARGIKAAFARSQALQDLQDPRQVVFTVLPGHGIVIAEKWAADKAPFQLIWEYMDEGLLQVENHIPQGPLDYVARGDQRVLREG
jgi:hypothetical protein